MEILFWYLVIINVVTFFMYGIDKAKAKFNKWRIPEATLLCVAFIGGSIGALLGMHLFRHKTKHMKFKIMVPSFLILHILTFIFIIR